MQAPSGGVQMPQLALQHTWPAPQVVLPHGSPPAPVDTHTALPSLSSQVVSIGQSVKAHGLGPTSTGTQTASPRLTSHVVPGTQSTR